MTVATVCPNCSAPLRVAGDTPSARCPHCRTAFRTSSSCALLAGRFELLHELGRGACGVVHEARDHAQNGRIVAVKRLLNAGAGDAEASHRLQREASIMAGVVHPNILPILAHGWAEEGGWVAMPRVPGITLKDAIPPGGIADPRQAVRLAVQVLRALHHVYSAHGVLHRDVKPGNVLLHEDGQSVYLIDFGLAVPPDPDKAMRTSDGILLGTPAYMPPEQARGQLGKLSHAVDVYAAAALLFHLLTGRVPFPAPYPAVLFDISQKKPPVPSSLRAGLDEKLDELVLRGAGEAAGAAPGERRGVRRYPGGVASRPWPTREAAKATVPAAAPGAERLDGAAGAGHGGRQQAAARGGRLATGRAGSGCGGWPQRSSWRWREASI